MQLTCHVYPLCWTGSKFWWLFCCSAQSTGGCIRLQVSAESHVYERHQFAHMAGEISDPVNSTQTEPLIPSFANGFPFSGGNYILLVLANAKSFASSTMVNAYFDASSSRQPGIIIRHFVTVAISFMNHTYEADETSSFDYQIIVAIICSETTTPEKTSWCTDILTAKWSSQVCHLCRTGADVNRTLEQMSTKPQMPREPTLERRDWQLELMSTQNFWQKTTIYMCIVCRNNKKRVGVLTKTSFLRVYKKVPVPFSVCFLDCWCWRWSPFSLSAKLTTTVRTCTVRTREQMSFVCCGRVHSCFAPSHFWTVLTCGSDKIFGPVNKTSMHGQQACLNHSFCDMYAYT